MATSSITKEYYVTDYEAFERLCCTIRTKAEERRDKPEKTNALEDGKKKLNAFMLRVS